MNTQERLWKLIESSRRAHEIMAYDEKETTDWRLEKKPVLESRMLDECESLVDEREWPAASYGRMLTQRAK